MRIEVHDDSRAVGRAAATAAAAILRHAIAADGQAALILATGVSQFAMLEALVGAEGVDWGRVTAFHLDEYEGLPADHPASFRRYLHKRFVSRLPALGRFVGIEGEAADPQAALDGVSRALAAQPVALCLAGIGGNGHLAFNEPPAAFDTPHRALRVDLAPETRRQQLDQGWFAALDEVPRRGLTLSVPQIMAARTVLVLAHGAHKARAVAAAVAGPVTPDLPASILQRHDDCRLFLDPAAAAGLDGGQAPHPGD